MIRAGAFPEYPRVLFWPRIRHAESKEELINAEPTGLQALPQVKFFIQSIAFRLEGSDGILVLL